MKGLWKFSALLVALTSAGAMTGQAAESRGAYVAKAGDCAACHTAPGGQAMAGGLAMQTPVGAIYSTNITPDKQTGIGDYSLAEFDRAVRQGIAKDGHRLYPAMPYPSFTRISDEDLAALYGWLMKDVKPIVRKNRVSDIPWPLSMRWPLAIWNTVFGVDGRYRPDNRQSGQWNRGAYLVQGLGHCSTCHTPRGIGFQEKAESERDADWLTGGTLEGWHAPNLTGDPVAGLGGWHEQDIVAFLRTGHTARSAAFGAMSQVVSDSTQHLTEGDLKAIAVYLKSLKPQGDERASQADSVRDDTTAALAAGQVQRPGAQLYLDNCAACHRSNGQGYANTFPALAGNSAVLSPDPSSLISVVLKGSRVPVTAQSPTGLTMPDFGWRLSDEEAAQVISFIRNSWGNQAPAVKTGDVTDIRQQAK